MMKTLTFMFLCVAWLCEPLQAQYDIASSNLRTIVNTNASRKKVKNQVPANQDKSALKMGTRICVSLNGKPTEAMVTGSAPVYGSNKDSYSISVTEEGVNYKKQLFLKPTEISSVGECPVEYFEAPARDVNSLDIRKLENEIIKEVNILRANPKAYAEEIAKLKFETFGYSHNRYQYIALGNGDHLWSCSEKDQSCVADFNKKLQVAINFLRNFNTKLDPVKENSDLAKACELLAADPGKIDGPGHKDSKGRSPAERCKVAGYKNSYRGEVLFGGHTTAAGYIVGYLTSPGHRDILLGSNSNEVGVDVHKHGSGKEAGLRNVIILGYDPNQSSAQTGVAVAPSKTPTPATPSTVNSQAGPGMKPGDKLLEGQTLVSANGTFQLRGTPDGNFVVEDVKSGAVLYTFPLAGPINNPPSVSFLSYNPDGNICINSKQNKGYCATNGRDGVARVILNKSERALVTNDGRFVLINKQGQEIWSTKSRHIITKRGYVVTVNGSDAESQAHTLNVGDEMFIAPYKQEKPHRHLVQGHTYDIFAVGKGGDRSGPQSRLPLYPDPDRTAWTNALKTAGFFKVISVGNTPIHPYDSYTLSAQQAAPNGPIQLTFDVYKEVNGKRQQLLTTFTVETKPMKWPL